MVWSADHTQPLWSWFRPFFLFFFCTVFYCYCLTFSGKRRYVFPYNQTKFYVFLTLLFASSLKFRWFNCYSMFTVVLLLTPFLRCGWGIEMYVTYWPEDCIQPCSLMWRICQCCSLKYFLPKIPKYHFVGVCDETYQKVHDHYNLHEESGVHFKIIRKMLFSLKPKDPFPWTWNLKGGFVSVNNQIVTNIF